MHLLQQRLTRTPRQATSMHMPQICRSDACVSMFGGTKGTQCSPLRCSALRGCPGACCACRSATTGLSKLRCHSMQRCFQHLVFCVQRSSHMRHQWLALKTGTQSTLRHDMSSCRVMPEAMRGHSRHAPRHCALMPAVEGVRRAWLDVPARQNTCSSSLFLARGSQDREHWGARSCGRSLCLFACNSGKKHVVGLGAECGRSDWASITSSMGMCLRLPPRH